MHATLHVIGSLMVDRVLRVPALPKPGETVMAHSAAVHPGGKGANQAVAAARCGARVRMLGRTGSEGEFIVRELAAAGVETASIQTGDAMSGFAAVMVADDGMNSIVIASEANGRISDADIDAFLGCAKRHEFVLMQNECSGLAHAVAAARTRGVGIWLNAAPMGDAVRQIDLGALACLLVNEHELAALTDLGEPEAALDRLANAWPKLDIVVTLGAAGWIARVDGALLSGRAIPVEAIDTVGCGDAFVGALAALRCAGMPWIDALARANAAGALAATKAGAMPSIPDRCAIESMTQRSM
ncbi:MAG: ribokinase [Planctomycetes bacterium]|nr:ribokinase [Planctomycetota bacterium]